VFLFFIDCQTKADGAAACQLQSAKPADQLAVRQLKWSGWIGKPCAQEAKQRWQ
jgi:hypothetical protein